MKRIFFISIIFIFLIAGCGNKQETMKKTTVNENKSISKQKEKNQSTPEEVVKILYENKLKLNDEFIKEYFYSPEKFDIILTNKNMKNLGITNINLDKIYKIDKKENYAFLQCIDSTYYKGIEEPIKDIKPFILIYDNEKWYIVNDLDSIKEEDSKLVSSSIQKQQEKMMEDDEIKDIIKSQEEFIRKHKGFFEEKQKIINKNLMEEKKDEPIDEVQKQQEINEEINQQMKQQKQIEEGTKKDK